MENSDKSAKSGDQTRPSHTQRLKIALMSYPMDGRQAKGTALYTRMTVRELLKVNAHDYTLVHFDKDNDPVYSESSGGNGKANEIIMPEFKLPLATRFLRTLAFFWKYRRGGSENPSREKFFDIIVWFQPRLYPFFWLAPAKKIVVVCHAAGDITAPTSFYSFSREVFNWVMIHFNKYTDALVAVSEFAKKEIIEYYRAPKEKLYIAPCGGQEKYHPIDKASARKVVLEKYCINRPYIVCIARFQAHKNVARLVEAYNRMRSDHPERREILVLVGQPVHGYDEVNHAVTSSKYKEDILIIKYIEQQDLNAIYSASELSAFISLNEGFGLPVLEAMASGTPVVVSNLTSLPEIAGPAGVLVDPYDVKDIASGLNKVLSASTEDRSKLIELGLEQAKKFTWIETERKLRAVFDQFFIQTTCPLCQKNIHTEKILKYIDTGAKDVADVAKITTEIEYSMYQCPNCSVQFWLPMRNPGASWYENDHRYSTRNNAPLLEPNWNHRKVISFLKRFTGRPVDKEDGKNAYTGKVLDIGCGTGNFLHHAMKNGWQPYGIDFDHDAIKVAKTVFGLQNTYVSDLDEYTKNLNQKFDLVTFFDVFEHVDNHNHFIEKVREILKPGGFIAMSMPYRGGFNWLKPHDLPPRHLTRWGRSSLSTYLENHGFEVVYITRRFEGFHFLVLKLRFRFIKYFSFLSFGLVNKIRKIMISRPEPKKVAGTGTGASTGAGLDQGSDIIRPGSKQAMTVKVAEKLAMIKDYAIFGLPALFIYIGLLFTRGRFVTLYAIGRKKG